MNDNLKFGNKSSDPQKYVGRGSSKLGVDPNTSLSEVIDKIMSEVEKLAVNIAENKEETFDIKSAFNSEFYLSDVQLLTEIKPSDSSVFITHKIKGLEDPVVSSSVTVEGIKNGYKSIIVNGNDINSGFNILPNNFPATLNAEIKTLSQYGEKVYKISVPLVVENITLSNNFLERKVGASNVNSQNDVNKVFDDNIISLRSQIGALSKINIDQSTSKDLPSFITNLYNEVTSIKEQLSSLKEAVPNVDPLSNKISSLEVTVQSAISNINRMDSQYKNLSSTVLNAANGSFGGTSPVAGNNSNGSVGGSSSNNQSSGSGSTGSNSSNNSSEGFVDEKTYGYCCSSSGCTYKLITEPCNGGFYPSLIDCQTACGTSGTEEPTSGGPCDVVILYNQENSCSDFGIHMDAKLKDNLTSHNFTITKQLSLTGFGTCKYVAKVKCGSKTSPEFKASLYTDLESMTNQVKSWIFANCTCNVNESEESCTNIEGLLTITPTFSNTNVKFEAVKGGSSFPIEYRRINGTYVKSPSLISISDLSSNTNFQVEFKCSVSGKTCTFIKTYKTPGTNSNCGDFKINSITYNNPGLSIQSSGGTPPFQHYINASFVDNINTIVLSPGTYTYSALDANLCGPVFKDFTVGTSGLIGTNCIVVTEGDEDAGTAKTCLGDPITEYKKTVTFSLVQPINEPLIINFKLQKVVCGGAPTLEDVQVIIPAYQSSYQYEYVSSSAVDCGTPPCGVLTQSYSCAGSNSKNFAYCPGIVCATI